MMQRHDVAVMIQSHKAKSGENVVCPWRVQTSAIISHTACAGRGPTRPLL